MHVLHHPRSYAQERYVEYVAPGSQWGGAEEVAPPWLEGTGVRADDHNGLAGRCSRLKFNPG